MRRNLLFLLLVLIYPISAMAQEETFVVIAHERVPKTDLTTLQRLYTGRVLSIAEQAAMPVNLPAGNALRRQFLEAVMAQTEEQYTGYWLVRRYVGKGTPPREIASIDDVLRYVAETPGAVAYVPQSRVPKGGNVIFRQ